MRRGGAWTHARPRLPWAAPLPWPEAPGGGGHAAHSFDTSRLQVPQVLTHRHNQAETNSHRKKRQRRSTEIPCTCAVAAAQGTCFAVVTSGTFNSPLTIGRQAVLGKVRGNRTHPELSPSAWRAIFQLVQMSDASLSAHRLAVRWGENIY